LTVEIPAELCYISTIISESSDREVWEKRSMDKPLKYTRHARRRMKWRKITETEVEQTLQNPDKIDSLPDGRQNAFKILGHRHIRVSYRDTQEEKVIISAVDKRD